MNWRRTFFLTISLFVLIWLVPGQAASNAVSLVSSKFRFLPPALLWHNTVELQSFLDKLGDLDRTDVDGMTLMHYFATDGLFPAVELLLHLGAKVDVPDKRSLLPVDYAKLGGHI